ncbi:MAG: twin-arginine translocase TatA/TatE family subunit [Bacteroidetes bacterium]|nr:twin-arginine translocase TatA/TatE family subunit [Bacteroidota bacterium]MBL7104070.1 twin-arginine translocase TatA/TatE family subunit [Bacteroidales bacterium]
MNNFLLFFSISGGEILVIIIVVYLVFGPKKLPELARKLGKVINEIKKTTNDIKREINKETTNFQHDLNIDLDDPLKTDTPKNKTEPPDSKSSSENKKK